MALENKERAKELLDKSSSETVKYYEDGKRQIHLQVDKKDGESVAFLEVPKYIPEEIEKALDINVDELVRNRKDLPEVVLKSLYDDLEALLRAANERIRDLEATVADLESQLAQVTSERDAEIERRIAAELALSELENLYIALSDQFAQTVFELQKAIERSTQEAIERVSLEARFEAIKAQLNASLLAIEALEAQVDAEQEEEAFQEQLTGEPGSYGISGDIGWRLPQNTFDSGKKNFFIETRDDNKVIKRGPSGVTLYNFSVDGPKTLTIGTSGGWLNAPSSVTIPPREGENPGVKHIRIQYKEYGRTDERDRRIEGSLNIQGGGVNIELTGQYDKEVRREDEWGIRPKGQTIGVGSGAYTDTVHQNEDNNDKIICNELYKQGYLPELIWDADERWGAKTMVSDPKLVIGYQMWARKVVRFMKENPKWTPLVYFLCKPWTEWMAYDLGVLPKTNWRGWLTHEIGKRFSYLVFDLYNGKRLLNLYNYKKFRESIG